jgi:glutamate-1-semialdehyde 2,1-aminomutase
VLEEYLAQTPRSRSMHEQLSRVLPGGETRHVTHYLPYPVAVGTGSGGRVVDVDGNEYLDVLNNYTSLVHGHSFGPVTEAIAGQAACGTVFPAPHRAQLELAELLVERFPAVELVRFTNSGTEAAMLAARIARRATGRTVVVAFEGGYHGSAPEFLGEVLGVRRVPLGDEQALVEAVDDTCAAVFVEPFLGSGGVIPAPEGFLSAVSAVCRARGAIFVLDEVQSLRNAVTGSHGEQGLSPDLVLMGKVIGGGLPIGAVGGSADLLCLTAASRAGSLAHSGTFNGNAVACAAGVVALRHLDETAIATLNERAALIATGIQRVGRLAGCPVSVTRAGSIMHVHLPAPRRPAELHLALLVEGVYAAPRGMLNLSTALDPEDCADLIDGYGRALERLAALPDDGREI